MKSTTTGHVSNDNKGMIHYLRDNSIGDCPILVAVMIAICEAIRIRARMNLINIIVEGYTGWLSYPLWARYKFQNGFRI